MLPKYLLSIRSGGVNQLQSLGQRLLKVRITGRDCSRKFIGQRLVCPGVLNLGRDNIMAMKTRSGSIAVTTIDGGFTNLIIEDINIHGISILTCLLTECSIPFDVLIHRDTFSV